MKISISRAKLSMGANESSGLKSIVKILLGIFLLIFHLAFVFVSKLFNFWRLLAHDKGLQSELEATNKDGDCVRQRLKFQDAQLEKLKERQDLSAEEEQNKYG